MSVLLLLLACGSDVVTLSDEHNYLYSGAMSLPSQITASGQDVEVCWDALARDLQCRDLDPLADIDSLSLLRFPHLDQEDIVEGLERDSLTQAELDGVASLETQGSCASLADLSFFGTPIELSDHYKEGGGNYLLMLATGTEPGQGTRALAFLQPSHASEIVQVHVDDACGTLDFQARLSPKPVAVDAQGAWTLDWSGLTVNGMGLTLDAAGIDRLELAFYEGASRDQLEEDFLELETSSSLSFAAELDPGYQYKLNDLDGFESFGRTDGIWLLALRCSTCSNPAPLFLATLEPQP
jgi:hypothetical protein